MPSAIASAAHETPIVKPPSAKAPTRKRPAASPSQRHPSTQASRTPHPARPGSSPPAQASRKQRSRQGYGPPAKRTGTVYLTFDDGPSQYTPAILDVLRATHSTATFFELGFRQAQHPTEAAQIKADGSNIGNHTYNHPDLTALRPRQIQWQLAHGPRSSCVRPPYGATNRTVKRILSRQGFRQVLWTIDTRDSEPTRHQAHRQVGHRPQRQGGQHLAYARRRRRPVRNHCSPPIHHRRPQTPGLRRPPHSWLLRYVPWWCCQ